MNRLNTLRTWTLLTLGLLAMLVSACTPALTLGSATSTPVPPTTTPVPPTATPLPPTSTPAPESPADDPVVGIEWRWERFLSGDGSTLIVSDPSLYTLILNADGTYQILVDCNRGSGSYVLEGGALSIEPGALTRAMCPPDSLHDTYLDRLSHVRTWTVTEEGRLVLDLFADAGQMVFGRVPSAAEQELVGIEWRWERFLGGDGSTIEVDDPARYTLTLNANGTYTARADCNRSLGGYTLDGAQLTLQPGPTTLAECGPGSLYDTYLRQLGDVRTWTMTAEGKLVLDLWADAGQMVLQQA